MNDGSLKGKRIFECPSGYGSFVRGSKIVLGDFPVRDMMDSDEDNEDEI